MVVDAFKISLNDIFRLPCFITDKENVTLIKTVQISQRKRRLNFLEQYINKTVIKKRKQEITLTVPFVSQQKEKQKAKPLKLFNFC